MLQDRLYAIYDIQVRCTDNVGNDSAVISNPSQINIDTVGPIGLVASFPLSTSPTSLGKDVVITTLPADATTWAYSVDDGNSWTSQENTSIMSFTLAKGNYAINTVQIKCADDIGNQSVILKNQSLIVIAYYNGYVPPIVVEPGADPTVPVIISAITTLDLTDTAVIGVTQAEQQQFTTNVVTSLFSANITQSQLVLPVGSILPGYSTFLAKPLYLFNASSSMVNGAKTILTHADIVGKYFYVLLEAGDTIQMQTNIDMVTISKTGNTFTITSSVSTTTAVVGDTYDYDGLHVILGSIIGDLVPSTVHFVMSAMNNQFMLNTSARIPNYTPTSFTSDATITLSNTVPSSVLQQTFYFRCTEETNVLDASYVFFYVDLTKWPNANTVLNPSNGIVTGNCYIANDTVGKDFLRDLAKQLFGTYLGADLFTNEDSFIGDVVTNCDQVASDIVTLLTSLDKTNGSFNGISVDSSGNKYMYDNPSTSNISRELFNQLATVAPGRFQDLKNNYKYNISDDGYYRIPILPGDTFSFQLTISPSSSQVSSVPTGPVNLDPRTYTVIMHVG